MLKKFATFLFLLAALSLPLAAGAAEEMKPAGHEPAVAAEHGGEHPLMDLDLSSAVWTLVIFLILLGILYKTAWKQVLAGLKAREQRIRNDIAEAESARSKAEATLRDYNKQLADAEARSREILNQAKSDAETLAAQIRTRGQQEAEEARERATREIEEAKNAAVREIHQQAAVLATTVAEKIIRRSLNADDYRELVNQSLGELQGMEA